MDERLQWRGRGGKLNTVARRKAPPHARSSQPSNRATKPAVYSRKALADGSRAPHSVPLRTSDAVERIVVTERRLHPTWGPKKIRAVLERKHAMEAPPAISTLGEILKRHGMIEARRRRPGAFDVKRGNLTEALRPNHVWATDFKGWFPTQDKERCDPLTVTDLFSRYLLGVQALPQATQAWTRVAYTSLFRTHGLPEIIRMDI